MMMDGERIQKYNRIQRHEPRRRKRPTRNKHHLVNRVRGGKSTPDNLLVIKVERHCALHKIFHNMSWSEIGDALYSVFNQRDPQKCYEVVERIARLKRR